MASQITAPVIALTWSGSVNDDWYVKAEKLLESLQEYVTYTYKSVGLFGDLKISSKTTSSNLTFKVDTQGKTRGVLRVMEKDTHVFILFIMALSKGQPFQIATDDSQIPRISCNPENPIFKKLSVTHEQLSEVGVLLGIEISMQKRLVPGAAAFF